MVFKYYTDAFSEGGLAAAQALLDTETIVSTEPHAGPVIDEFKSLRRLRVLRTPFSLIYRIEGEAIEVLRIWDARQLGLDM